MADIANTKDRPLFFNAKPEGNLSRVYVEFDIPANGADAGDNVLLTKLAPGIRIWDIGLAITDAGTGNIDLGLLRRPIDAAKFTNDVDVFFDNLNATVGFDSSVQTTRHKPQWIQQPEIWLSMRTISAQAARFAGFVMIDYEWLGIQ